MSELFFFSLAFSLFLSVVSFLRSHMYNVSVSISFRSWENKRSTKCERKQQQTHTRTTLYEETTEVHTVQYDRELSGTARLNHTLRISETWLFKVIEQYQSWLGTTNKYSSANFFISSGHFRWFFSLFILSFCWLEVFVCVCVDQRKIAYWMHHKTNSTSFTSSMVC